MTKELLIDLCARLPYGVKIKIPTLQEDTVFTLVGICEDYITVMKNNGSCFDVYTSIDGFPILRPMSSMIEEEKKEVSILLNYEFYIDDDCALVAEDDRHRIRLDLMQIYIDWLNANYFDYRGLIEKGLAIEVNENNNPYKE